VSQLDELYTLVQELITNRLRLNQAVDGLDGLIGDLDREGLDGFESESGELLTQTSHEVNQLETITSRIQETVMDIRLVQWNMQRSACPVLRVTLPGITTKHRFQHQR